MIANTIKKARTISRLMVESTVMGLTSLKTDRFRTVLSLTGVSIGIFSIVAVFCAINALKANINEGLNSFGSDIVYIQKWPFTEENPSEPVKWWEYRLRPNITEKDFNFVKEHSRCVSKISYMSSFYGLFKNGSRSFSNGYIMAAAPDMENLMNMTLSQGRYFSGTESHRGANVAVIGSNVAEALFSDGENPVGRAIKVKGMTSTVIGVLKKQGESMLQIIDLDNAVVVPLNYGKMMSNVSEDGTIIAAPAEGVSGNEIQGELRQLIRSFRRLKPSQKDNFAVNTMTFLIQSLDKVMVHIRLVGWIIAAFSLLIGGFGIANIMFVSVKERTNQIGIQKALGAPKYVIMIQFMVEAAVLSIAGGLVGVFLVFLISVLYNPESFTLSLSAADVLSGIAISMVIGLISGIIPANLASKMNPVDAINS